MPIEQNFGQSGVPRPASNDSQIGRDNYRPNPAEDNGGQEGIRRMLAVAVNGIQRFDGQPRQNTGRDQGFKVFRFPKPEDFETMRQLVANRTPVRRGTFLNIVV